MILSTHGVLASQILQVDADWLAYYNRVIAAGGSLNTTEQSATLQLVLDLKSYGIWSAMKAIYPMVGASSAACKQNLKSSSFTGSFSTGWTFASTGVTPNGTSAYMDTGLPNNTMTQNSNSFGVYLRTTSQATTSDIGVFDNGFGSNIYSNTNIGMAGFNNATALANSTHANYLGFFLNKRTSGSQMVLQKNSTQTTLNIASTTFITSNFILSRTGNADAEYSNRQNAFAFIGDGLTDTQASNFYTAVQAFQTTLSRQV